MDSSVLAEESAHISGLAVTFRLSHEKLTSLRLHSDSGHINPKSLERLICLAVLAPNAINYQRLGLKTTLHASAKLSSQSEAKGDTRGVNAEEECHERGDEKIKKRG